MQSDSHWHLTGNDPHRPPQAGQVSISTKLALVACMRKLLVILNTMAKTNEPWRTSDAIEAGE